MSEWRTETVCRDNRRLMVVEDTGTGTPRIITGSLPREIAEQIIADHNRASVPAPGTGDEATRAAEAERLEAIVKEAWRFWAAIQDGVAESTLDRGYIVIRVRADRYTAFDALFRGRAVLAGDRAAEGLPANDWAVLYRLIDQYTEDAYKDLPKDHPSHATRRAIRERVTRHLIAAREQERAALDEHEGAEAP